MFKDLCWDCARKEFYWPHCVPVCDWDITRC